METFTRTILSANLFTMFLILSMYMLSCGLEQTVAQEERPDYTSTVPQYTFPATLEEQEEVLRTNPLMLRFAESRERLSTDPHRPIYHFVNPEGNLNDPNGFSFWNGNWHLFYQAYPPEDPRQNWNHIMSLPMRLTLKDRDELRIEPAGDIESLRYDHQSVDRMVLPANREIVLDHIKGNAIEIMVEIDPKSAQNIELNVLRSPDRQEYTQIIFYRNRRFWDSNSELISLDAWQMNNIWDISLEEWYAKTIWR